MSRNNTSRNVVLAVVIIVLILGGIGGYFVFQLVSHSATTPNSSTTDTASNLVGVPAPTFVSPTVNQAGGNFNLSDYRGKSNVLILFNEGLSCSPCLQQMVDMNSDYGKFSALNTVIVGITADSSSDLSQWAKVNGIGSMIVISNQNLKIFNAYGMSGSMMSHTFVLIDASGTIRWIQNYPSMFVQENQLISIVNSSLA